MPFDRPPLSAIQDRVAADIEAELGVGPLAPRSALRAMGQAVAAQAHLLHGNVAWATTQILPTTATGEWLERHASLYGVTRRVATRAVGEVRLQGAIGAIIPAGTRLVTNDSRLYRTLVVGEITPEANGSGSATILAEATEAGFAGNILGLGFLSLFEPVSGVLQNLTAPEGFAGGADREGDEDLRARILLRLQEPPQGGSRSDYEIWALEVPGVTRAWPIPNHNGPGTVSVTFAADNSPTGPIPSEGLVEQVREYIEERRPVTVTELTVFAPEQVEIDLEIELSPNTAAVRAAVQTALSDLLVTAFAPGTTLHLSQISEAISNAPGEDFHVLIEPTQNVSTEQGQLLVLGSVTFTE